MRRQGVEALIIGSVVGLLVMLIRALVADAPEQQIAALGVAALLLGVAQIALVVRRAARRSAAPRAALLRRTPPQDPFTREANQSWTGLVDHQPNDILPPVESARPPKEE